MRRFISTPRLILLGAVCAGSVAFASWRPHSAVAVEKPASEKQSKAEVDPSALERARREVKMLDDLYKTTIVYINDTYVKDGDEPAAGEIAREIFAAMKKKGWHDARLVDATGKPTNDDNAPRDAFEKQAAKKILGGETYCEEVVRENGKTFLRAATLVPVVNQKCLMCHPGHKVGDVLGTVSYKISLD